MRSPPRGSSSLARSWPVFGLRASQTEDVRLYLRIVVQEYIAVLANVGIATERVAAVALLQRILGIDVVAGELGRRMPLILAIPPDARARRLGHAQVGGHRRIIPVQALIEHRVGRRVIGRFAVPRRDREA